MAGWRNSFGSAFRRTGALCHVCYFESTETEGRLFESDSMIEERVQEFDWIWKEKIV